MSQALNAPRRKTLLAAVVLAAGALVGTAQAHSDVKAKVPGEPLRVYVTPTPQGEILTAQLNYSNGLDPVATIRADSEISGLDPGMPSASISMTAKFADTALLNKATSQTPVAVQLQWASAARTLTVTLGRVFLPRRKRPITGPAGIQIDLDGMAATPAGAPLLRAVLVNNKASY